MRLDECRCDGDIDTLVTNGDTEDVYEATNTTMTMVTFRPGAYKTVILITDEDRDPASDLVPRKQICQLLGAVSYGPTFL